jgi:hypothetical protein
MTITHIGTEPIPEDARECGLNMHEVLAHIPGMTYRQLDFWTKSGRITRHFHHGGRIVTEGGSGKIGCWPRDQVAIASRMHQLTTRGIENLDIAKAIATDLEVAMDWLAVLTKIEAELAQ